ncbi:adenine phosphoribosyltransferase [Helicobacter cholecystus]|uniref:adenine phosphoribosyltransferase n=1 Tax=Helicobacter cholecystus TaxID=45498 RepID=UPI002739A3D2|nr:adenine phosphoribosyltransferase [Helicobacter cholecystus]
MLKQKLLSSIREIPNYPKEGILFKDITTLIGNAEVFSEFISHLCQRYKNQNIDYIVGLESRGFIFGSALAYAVGAGFVPIRKKGKLPYKTICKSYALEYGEDSVEIHIDAFGHKKGARVVLIDDLIATGGTARAGVELIEAIGGECVEACFLLDLVALNGSQQLSKKVKVYSILEID